MDSHRLINALTDLAFYELDRDGRVRVWSDSAARLLGYGPDETVGQFPLRMAAESPNEPDTLKIAESQGRANVFGWFFRKDGSRFWANELTMPVQNARGEITGFARMVRDASPLGQTEEERDRIFALSVDLLCVANSAGYFTRVSSSFMRLLGHTEAELLGRRFIDFVHPDDLEMTRQETVNIGTPEHVASRPFRNRYRCADGTYRWLEWRSQASPSDDRIYAAARDVTDQKAVEEKLQEYARELERSNSELQQFAYVASHDLQEPLRAVAGCVQMLAERNPGRLDERSTELMGHAVDGAKRMQALINDLLAFSRVGSKGVSKAMIEIPPTIEKALRLLKTAVDESGAVVTIGPLPPVFADATRMAQLFQNLIGNAIKFRKHVPPAVHIFAEPGNDAVVFSVRDNGIGITPEYKERVFGLFQRLHSRGAYPGTGIGLAICKKIVELHGGRIWIEPQSGEGTTLKFTIPIE